MEREWLRKDGTMEVFSRTATLAKRKDMVAISDEEAKRIISTKGKVVGSGASSSEPQKTKTIDEMNLAELRDQATILKISVHPNAKEVTIRDRIKKVLADEAEAEAQRRARAGMAPVAPVAPVADAVPPEAPAPAAPEAQ